MDFPQEIWVYFEQTDVASKFIFSHHFGKEYAGKEYAGYIQAANENGAKLLVSLKNNENVVASGTSLYPFFTTFGACMEYRQNLLKSKIKQLSIQFDKSPKVIE